MTTNETRRQLFNYLMRLESTDFDNHFDDVKLNRADKATIILDHGTAAQLRGIEMEMLSETPDEHVSKDAEIDRRFERSER